MVDYLEKKRKILQNLLIILQKHEKIDLNEVLIDFEIETGFSPKSAMKYVEKWSARGMIGDVKGNMLVNRSVENE